jgi:putative tricarboxylic transport membrane protein
VIERISRQVPYLVVLLVAGFLYYRATQIDFTAPGDRIGPDVWPKAILILAMATCAYEIVKNLVFSGAKREIGGVLESIIEETPAAPDGQTPAPLHPWRLAVGAGLTIAYALGVDKLGFFLCTALFLCAYIRIGGYRRTGITLLLGVAGSLAFTYTFMKVVYISLPLGVGVFGQFSILLIQLLGIR